MNRLALMLLLLAAVATLIALFVRPSAQADPATFTVNSTNDADDGVCDATHCSLREAIKAANATAGPNLVAFDIPGSPPFTIRPLNQLPDLTDADTEIDGTTQPGYGSTPVIEISGSLQSPHCFVAKTCGLMIYGDRVRVKALVLNRFTGGAVGVFAGSEAVISGNYLGTDVSGTAARTGGVGVTWGVDIAGESSVAVVSGNLISGWDSSEGFGILAESANGATIVGNLIGTDVTGTLPIPNNQGIKVSGATIGGESPEDANVIAGNSGGAILAQAPPVTIIGNYLGTDRSATLSLPSGSVQLEDSHIVVDNVVAGGGIGLSSGAHGNDIRGNFVGTDPSGTRSLNGQGISLGAGTHGNVIGGPNPGNENVIAFSGGPGIGVAPTAWGNTFQRNSIYQNDGLGIDLNNDGPTANDPDDLDSGANGLLNFPVVESVTEVTGGYQVTGTGPPLSTVEIFAADPDPSGFGEGKTFLADTEANESGLFSLVVPSIGPSNYLTATSTDVQWNTSEFSAAVAYWPPVGGIAELPDVAESRDSPTTYYIAVAGLAPMALLALTATAWYTRRRWLR